jgi:hypothetical protein
VRRISLGIYGLALLLLLPSTVAYAYRAARIGADQAEVKDAPNGNTQASLPKGTRVNTSDRATDGYYRIRSTALSGWVQEGDLEFLGAAPQQQTQRQKAERMADRNDSPDQSESSSESSSPHPWALKVFGGLDFFNPSQVDGLIGSSALQNGTGFGGELDYGFTRTFYLGFRVEDISKSATGPDAVGNTFQFNLSSVPVMVGLMLRAANGSNFSWDFGAYVGEAFGTQVSGTATNLAAPNVTTISASAPTFLIDTDVNWHITEPFWIFAELGYRYLQTSSQTPTTVGAGQGIFQNSSGSFVAVPINLSGPVVNFGLRLNF